MPKESFELRRDSSNRLFSYRESTVSESKCMKNTYEKAKLE